MFERPKRKIPGLNMTATADISFMLLIFFLVTSSMDSEKVLPTQLPPPQQEQLEKELKVKERNVLDIRIDANDKMSCNGESITHSELTERIKTFVANVDNAPDLPEKSIREVNYFGKCEVSDRHVLYIQVDRQTSYDAYFQLQNTIKKAYRQLRNNLAKKHFGRSLNRCSRAEQEAIGMIYPKRISEEPPSVTVTEETRKGGQP